MADEDGDQEHGLEEEEWTEPTDLSELPDGNSTVLVGGFSPITSINAAVGALKSAKDRIVVLKGSYEGDVVVDTTKWKGLIVVAEEGSAAHEVKIDGRLVLEWSAPLPGATADQEQDEPPSPKNASGGDGDDAEENDAGEGGEKKRARPPRPQLLSFQGLAFLNGCVAKAQTAAEVVQCVFGTRSGSHRVPQTVAVHALSTATFRRCHIYGSQQSAVYGYPHARGRFERCDVVGCEKPSTTNAAPVKQKRGAAAPPPPPPTAPEKCECEVGAYCDDSALTFTECTFSGFDIGVLTRDKCKGLTFERCALSLLASVGILIDANSEPTVRNTVVKLCRRECAVVGNGAHPILRGNTFVGNVRLKSNAVATGISDNVLGLGGQLWDDAGGLFAVKGFKTVETDPTLIKPKKVAASD